MPRKPKEENDQLAKTIGEQITQAMGRLSITVTELHKRTGISRTVLLAYTRGTYAPGAREIKLLCDNLDITPSVLLYGSNQVDTTPFRIGEIALSKTGMEVVAFMVLLNHLTAAERKSLLTLVEGISAARDANRHREQIRVIEFLLTNEHFQQTMDAFIAGFAAPDAMASMEKDWAESSGGKAP